MNPDLTHSDLITQLRILVADFERMKAFAQEVESRDYNALLDSTVFAVHACELRNRAVRLFNQIAYALRFTEEAQHVRLGLLQISKCLQNLFESHGGAAQSPSSKRFEDQSPKLTLRQLLSIFNEKSFSRGGVILHGQVLSNIDMIKNGLQTVLCNDQGSVL